MSDHPPLHLWRNKQGAAAAEMALVAPLLVLMLLSAVEIGRYLWHEHIVLKAVRDGARFASRQSFSNFNCASGSLSDAATETKIKNVTRTGQTSGGVPRLTGWNDSQVKVVVTCNTTAQTGIYTGMTAGAPKVTVRTCTPAEACELDYASLFGSIFFNSSSFKLRGKSESMVMGL